VKKKKKHRNTIFERKLNFMKKTKNTLLKNTIIAAPIAVLMPIALNANAPTNINDQSHIQMNQQSVDNFSGSIDIPIYSKLAGLSYDVDNQMLKYAKNANDGMGMGVTDDKGGINKGFDMDGAIGSS
jgi:hypothetical protein